MLKRKETVKAKGIIAVHTKHTVEVTNTKMESLARMNRELTREEEAELSRSTKKVKDVHHAGFNDGLSEDGQDHDLHNAWGTDRKTFKEKLEGAIPGAYA